MSTSKSKSTSNTVPANTVQFWNEEYYGDEQNNGQYPNYSGYFTEYKVTTAEPVIMGDLSKQHWAKYGDDGNVISVQSRDEFRKYSSLKTGPETWVIVYEEKNGNGRHHTFGPNSNIPVLADVTRDGRLNWDNDIESFKLFNHDPNAKS